MTSPEHPELLEEAPRVDELFNRALVAQLAEQRAQRETFAEVERKVEGLERVVTERLAELSRQLGTDGQLETRIELLEEMIGSRLASVERVVRTELDNRLGAMADRLHHVEQSLGGDDTGARLVALEATVKRRLGNLEEAVKLEELNERMSRMERTLSELAGVEAVSLDPTLGSRFEDLEKSVAERLAGLEELLRGGSLVRRLDSLETAVAERLSLLEDTVRSEEIGRRLKSLELALDERSGRIEEFVKTSDLEGRIEALARAVDEQLAEVRRSLANGGPVAVSPSGEAGEGAPGAVMSTLDTTVVARLSGLEGSLRQLQEDTAARLDDLRAASIASEAGILERIVAESHVVGAHFQAIRPVVEAAVAARPEIEQALAEVRQLADAARSAAADLMAGVAGPPAPTDDEPSGPYRVEELAAEAHDEIERKKAEDSVFQPPEETPIPDRRFGLRRDR